MPKRKAMIPTLMAKDKDVRQEYRRGVWDYARGRKATEHKAYKKTVAVANKAGWDSGWIRTFQDVVAALAGCWFDEDEAQRYVDFFQEYLVHIKGQWAGQPLILADVQKYDMIMPLFGWMRKDGTRRFRVAYWEVPRKNTKSTLAAGIGLALLFVDPETGAEIYSAATDATQAGVVFKIAYDMLMKNETLRDRARPYRNWIEYSSSLFKVLSSKPESKHGFNVSGLIVDELHAHKDRELVDVLETGRGSREQPVTVFITTAGHDRTGICWEKHEQAERVMSGASKIWSILPLIYSADPKDARTGRWKLKSVHVRANPMYGVAVLEEPFKEELENAKDTPAALNRFLNLHLNIWTQQAERWLPMDHWDACATRRKKGLLDGQSCVLGLDLATTTDLTACSMLFPLPNDQGIWVLPLFWIPAENMRERERRDGVPYSTWVREGLIIATPGNVIDYAEVRKTIKKFAMMYKFQTIGYDPWNATQIATELKDEDGFEMLEVQQGYKSMNAPSKELLRLILQHKLYHDGNPVLRWHADSVAVVEDTSPARNIKPVKPERKATGNRIDGIVATVIGLFVLMNTGVPKRSKYEEADLLSLGAERTEAP